MSEAVHWRTRAGDLKRTIKWWLAPSGYRSDRRALRACRAPDDYLAFAGRVEEGPTQLRDEILPFLQLAAEDRPARLLEIGTSWGGTNVLFGWALPTLTDVLGVDLFVRNRMRIRRLSRRGLRHHFFDGSSYATETVALVEHALAGRTLDVLFIDGDHSFDGVAQDFLRYRDLVRPGGLIAFHDIQPDGRDAGETVAYAGEVPQFWRRLSPSYDAREFIADPAQRGLGIGVIRYDPAVELPVEVFRRADGTIVH